MAKVEGPEIAEPISFKLRRPIQVQGETVSETSLREPTPKDIAAAGYPIVVHAEDGSIGFDAGIVHRLIVRLTGMPPSSVERMSRVDYLAHFNAVTSFFTVDEIGSPDPT